MNDKNILLTVAYDGTNYFGWQKQDNVKTIQGELEKALSNLFKQIQEFMPYHNLPY